MNLSKERLQEIRFSRENVYKRCGYEENFVVNEQTVEEIFDLYDDEFFGGQIQDEVHSLAKKNINGTQKPYKVNRKIDFYSTKRTSGYGSLSGFYFTKKLNSEGAYDYTKTFFIDICPNLFDNIFKATEEKGLPKAAGIGCDSKLKCFMLVMEHEIIHLLMSIYNYDVPELKEKNPSLFGPHGSLFNCMLETYFGHTQTNHNLALEGVYVPPFTSKKTSNTGVGAGFENWSNSCYLDSVIMVMLENTSDFWRTNIFDWEVGQKETEYKSQNPGLSKQVKKVLIKDYKAVHVDGGGNEAVRCEDLRELLSIQDPLMKTETGRWKMYESGSTYATFTQLFPSLLIDIPVKMIRPSIGEEESISYKTEAAFTFSDFMLSDEQDEDHKIILWEECQSPVLVFTHQGAPDIQVFDSTVQEKSLNKIRAFGPTIINEKYKLSGVVVLHGYIDAEEGGGGHYTCYFLAKDGNWYHYNDMGPTFDLIGGVENLPRKGVWEKSSTMLPTMYFYIRNDFKVAKQATPEFSPVVKLKTEKKQIFKAKKLDYIRIDRPDGGIIFIVVFKDPKEKAKIIKQIREIVKDFEDVVETKMDEQGDKMAWRLTNRKGGSAIQKILNVKESPGKSPLKISFSVKGVDVYDYSEKTFAVVGATGASEIDALTEIGLETLELKNNLGKGFVVPKTKLKKLKGILKG